MTDDIHDFPPHDPDNHNQDTDTASDPHQEADQTVWHDAPVDGFSDEPAAATISEEPEAPSEESDDLEPQPAKRNPLLAGAIIVGGVVFLGALGYLQFGGMLHGKSNNIQPLPPPIAAAEQPTNAAPKTSMLPTAPTIVSSPGTGTAMPEKPAAVAVALPPSPPTELPSTSPALAPAMQGRAELPLPTATSTAPVMTSGAPPAPMPAAALPSAPSMSPPPSVNVASAPSVADEARLSLLASRVDDMQKSLQDAAQKLAEISVKISANQQQQANPDIADRLSKIEQKLTEVEQRAAPAPAPVAVTDSAPNRTAGISQAASGMPTDLSQEPQHKALVHKTHGHKIVQRKKVKTKTVSHKTASPSTHWVLRAASTNQAWVAKDEKTAELRAVHVGDNLPGIGQIQTIAEGEGGWIIQGTTGTIH